MRQNRPLEQLTVEQLKRSLSYDPVTGIFTRLNSPCNSVQVGEQAGWLDPDGYIKISVLHRIHKAHRLAWLYVTGKFPTFQIDHINGIKNDNRFCNLRDVPQEINNQNRRIAQRNNLSTGKLGIYPNGSGFKVLLSISGERCYLGTHKTIEEAEKVFLEKKRAFHEGCTI